MIAGGPRICYAEQMMNTEELRNTLSRYGLTPNRALGQNFLVDADTLAAIAEAAEICTLPVLEIGPGLGALTSELVSRAPRVVAVEKDARLSEILPELVPEENLTVINGDILKTDIPSVMGGERFDAVGNLPYYITTPIAEKILCLAPRSATFLVQKEAAERFTAGPGARVYGPLAVLSGTCYRPEIVFDVPRNCFYPAPEVDSALVHLAPREGTEGIDNARFLGFLNRAFAMRRKTLSNNFRGEKGFVNAAEACGIDPGARAEAVKAETLYALYRELNG